LLSGFVNSLQAFVTKYNPEILFMEASGLSDPISIGQIFNAPQLQEMVYLAGTICIVDARNMGNFEKLTTRIHHQLQIADVVLINKTDLAENTEDILQKVGKSTLLRKNFLPNTATFL
jgi:G3E family GTPase